MKAEYRVVWKREGLRRKARRFLSLTAAERHVRRLTVEADPHYFCDQSVALHRTWSGNPDDPDRPTCMPPIVEGPVVEWRERLPWLLPTPEKDGDG